MTVRLRYRYFAALVSCFLLICTSCGMPKSHRTITERAVGKLRLGMTVKTARKVMKGYRLERSSDGEGVALISVKHGKKAVLILYAGEADSRSKVSENAEIELIEVTDSRFFTKAGVHVGMFLKQVERKYGKLVQIEKSEIESREYATFTKSPMGMTFQTEDKNGDAGIYDSRNAKHANGSRIAKRYVKSARLCSISIRKP